MLKKKGDVLFFSDNRRWVFAKTDFTKNPNSVELLSNSYKIKHIKSLNTSSIKLQSFVRIILITFNRKV